MWSQHSTRIYERWIEWRQISFQSMVVIKVLSFLQISKREWDQQYISAPQSCMCEHPEISSHLTHLSIHIMLYHGIYTSWESDSFAFLGKNIRMRTLELEIQFVYT
jgi:hypothetical protein